MTKSANRRIRRFFSPMGHQYQLYRSHGNRFTGMKVSYLSQPEKFPTPNLELLSTMKVAERIFSADCRLIHHSLILQELSDAKNASPQKYRDEFTIAQNYNVELDARVVTGRQ